MRPPKPLYAHERVLYQPALLTCPHWGALLVRGNSLAWDQTVPMRDRVLSVASRPGRCPHATWTGSRRRRRSAEGQRSARAGSTDGDDVVVRLGWWRRAYGAPFSAMHTALASPVRISVSPVRSLSQQGSLPLLAGHARQHHDHLGRLAKQQGGVIVALDGLAPQGGEPQLWGFRALSSGVPRRSGWLRQQDHPPFEAFLTPLMPLEWPILAVRSAKQTGLVPAVATGLPPSRHQFCQGHALRNLADSWAEAEAACQVARRHSGRQPVGDVLRQDSRTAPGQAGVWPGTGLVPRPLAESQTPASHSATPRNAPRASQGEAEEMRTQLVRHPRDLLMLKGRPPLRLAGSEMSPRLQHVAQGSLDLLAQR